MAENASNEDKWEGAGGPAFGGPAVPSSVVRDYYGQKDPNEYATALMTGMLPIPGGKARAGVKAVKGLKKRLNIDPRWNTEGLGDLALLFGTIGGVGYGMGSGLDNYAEVMNTKEIDNLDQRLQELEKRTISDIDLDNMTKPAGEVVEEERVGPAIGGLMERGVTQGLGSMKENAYDYAAPETQAYIGDVVRTEAVKDPELNDQQRAVIANMTDAQVLEMVEGIYSEAQNQGTTEEDVAEEEAESIIDRLMGNETEEMGWRERLNQMGAPEDINFAPTGLNHGGPVKQYNLGGIASMGRGGDSQLAHVMPGERMVPPGVMDDGMLDAAFVRAGLDPREYTVGNSQGSINPMTGMPEYGLFSFVKRLFKKVKKIAPVIGSMVGFAMAVPWAQA